MAKHRVRGALLPASRLDSAPRPAPNHLPALCMVAASAARRATRLATTKHTGIGHGQKQLHTATMNNFPSGSSPRSSPKHLGPVERLVRRFKGGAGHCDHDWSPDRLDSAEGKPGRRIESVDLDARFGALRLERDASSSFAPHYTHHRPHPSYRFSNSTSSPALSSTPPSHGSPAYRLDAPIHGATNSRREAAATRQYHQANGAPEHAKKYLTPWKQDTSSPWRPWTANKPLPLLLPYGRGDVLPPMPTPTPMFVDEPPKASPPPAAHARRPQSTFLPGSARVPLSKEAADVRFAEQQNQRTQETSVRRDPHLRAVSEPPPIRESPARRKEDLVSDPNHPPGLRQCWGIKRDGTRCMRKVGTAAAKSPLKGRQDVARSATSSPSKSVHRRGEAIVISDSESETAGRNSSDDEDIRRDYCHQHAREINKTEGFVLPGRRGSRLPRTSSVSSVSTAAADGRYVDFAPYLRTVSGNTGEEACKARLRAAMSRAPSDIDWRERGYLYIYEVSVRGLEGRESVMMDTQCLTPLRATSSFVTVRRRHTSLSRSGERSMCTSALSSGAVSASPRIRSYAPSSRDPRARHRRCYRALPQPRSRVSC